MYEKKEIRRLERQIAADQRELHRAILEKVGRMKARTQRAAFLRLVSSGHIVPARSDYEAGAIVT